MQISSKENSNLVRVNGVMVYLLKYGLIFLRVIK